MRTRHVKLSKGVQMRIKTCLFAVLAASVAVPVYSQSALEEIVVTAQRREQNLQDVPVSVTAFTGAAVEQGNIRAARDYLALTPNVAFTDDGQVGSKGIGIAVRGVSNMISGAAENTGINSIGIYMDGFSIASVPSGVSNPALPDMQSIEVLRGPQGTFFGRNSVGGALNLRTTDPTDEFGFKLTVGGESYENANEMGNVTAVINAPVSDDFGLRGVFMYEDSGGRVKNACATGASAAECPGSVENNFTPNGAKNSGYEEFFGRIKAVWDVSDDTTVSVSLTYADIDQGHDENVPSGILDVDTVDTLGISEAIDPGTGYWPDNRSYLSHDLGEYNKNEAFIAIVNIEHELNDNLKLTSITGVIDAENNRWFDQDLVGGVDSIDRTNHYEGTSWSTELRLDYSGDSIDWTLGAMYSKDKQDQNNLVAVSTNATHSLNGVGWLPPFPEDLGLAFNRKGYEVEEQALFGDLTFHMTESLDLIAGGRFTRSQVERELAANGIGPTTDFSMGAFHFFQSWVNFPRPVAGASSDFSDFAPRFGARFQITDEVNVYAMLSKGYKPGGSSIGNNTNVDGAPAFATKYDNETLWNYELGLKSELLEGRLRLNAAVFHLEWDDLQFESFFFLTPGDLSTNVDQIISIEDAEASGVEMEFAALVTDGLTISGGFGYLDTEVISDTTVQLSGGWRPSLLGLDLPKSPELTANLVGEYRWSISGDNEAWVRLEYIHRDGQYSDMEGVTNRQLNGPSPNNAALIHNSGPNEFPYRSPDHDLLNLRAGVEWGAWSITGFVQNLTDEKYYTGTQENFGVSGIRLRPNPLTIGGSISYTYGGI